jgi:hypothetical protein
VASSTATALLDAVNACGDYATESIATLLDKPAEDATQISMI